MTILLVSLALAAGSFIVLFATLEVAGAMDEREQDALREWQHGTVPSDVRGHAWYPLADDPHPAAHGARSKTSTSAYLPRPSATRRSSASNRASPALSA